MDADATAQMKVTTVRFAPDLWRLLEQEAARAGVRVSQYVRDAALARAVAAATERGEGPSELQAGAGNGAIASEAGAKARGVSLRLRPRGETNIEYVARLWELLRSGGAEELNGDALHEFETACQDDALQPTMFYGRGDDVLVRADGPDRQVWLLYRFDGRRLKQALAFASEAEALSYSAA